MKDCFPSLMGFVFAAVLVGMQCTGIVSIFITLTGEFKFPHSQVFDTINAISPPPSLSNCQPHVMVTMIDSSINILFLMLSGDMSCQLDLPGYNLTTTKTAVNEHILVSDFSLSNL